MPLQGPDGVTCDSVSGTYANAVQNNLPSQRRTAGASPGTPQAPRATEGITGAAAAGAAGAAASRIAVAVGAALAHGHAAPVVGPHPAALVQALGRRRSRPPRPGLRLRPGRRRPVARRTRAAADPRCLRAAAASAARIRTSCRRRHRVARPQDIEPVRPDRSTEWFAVPARPDTSGGPAADARRSAWQRTQRLTWTPFRPSLRGTRHAHPSAQTASTRSAASPAAAARPRQPGLAGPGCLPTRRPNSSRPGCRTRPTSPTKLFVNRDSLGFMLG